MGKIVLLLIICCLGYFNSNAQKSKKFTYEELDSLMNYCYVNEEYTKGILYLTEGRELVKDGVNDSLFAEYTTNIGFFYYQMGQYQFVESYFLEAKEIIIRHHGKEHKQYAGNLGNLGMLYKKMRQYELGESLLLECKRIEAKTLGTKHSDYAITLNVNQ